MRRLIRVIIVLTVLGISLTGCSSADRLEELEKRVEYLENVVLNGKSDKK